MRESAGPSGPLRGEAGGAASSPRLRSASRSDGKVYFLFQLSKPLQVCNKSRKLVYCRIFSVHLVMRILIPPEKEALRPRSDPRLLGWGAPKALRLARNHPSLGWFGLSVPGGLCGLWGGLTTRKGANHSPTSPASSPALLGHEGPLPDRSVWGTHR